MTAEELGKLREGHTLKVTFPKKPKDREEMNHTRFREAKSSESKETWPHSKRIQGGEGRWQAKEELKEERWKCAQERGSKAQVLAEVLSLIDSVKTHCLFSHRAWGRGADLICVSNIIWLLKHQMHEGRAENSDSSNVRER